MLETVVEKLVENAPKTATKVDWKVGTVTTIAHQTTITESSPLEEHGAMVGHHATMVVTMPPWSMVVTMPPP